jgi:Mg2+/citrate symporter
MDTVAEIIKYLLIFLGFMFLLLIVVLAILWKMSPTHPWRLVVAALARRLAATGGIALIDIPATAMQPLGDVWDIGSLILLAWYWYTFFRDDAGRALHTLRDAAHRNPKPR